MNSRITINTIRIVCFSITLILLTHRAVIAQALTAHSEQFTRERVSIGQGWKFFRYNTAEQADSLIYDVRPEITNERDDRPADTRPTEGVKVAANKTVLKPWILPTGNNFVKDPTKRYVRPEGNPGGDFPFVQSNFEDDTWEMVNIPHDWAIKGPFYKEENAVIGGGMGRLPVHGVAWYRKKINIPASDKGKSIFLEVDGAMSYAMVWLNGKLVGGWPYGYNSWQVDLTPYIIPGEANQLAIRLDNPASSARWYPGGGIYRNIWLIKTNPVHVGQWGAYVTTNNVSKSSATVDLKVTVNNDGDAGGTFSISTNIYLLDHKGQRSSKAVSTMRPVSRQIMGRSSQVVSQTVTITNPKLWGPPPSQKPNRYVAVTQVSFQGKLVDVYETRFGIRDLRFDANKGVFVNGERIFIKGANQHHDLGPLGAAFNVRAAERQLEILREVGCNAIRMSHNPPAPELLELTDRMGFLVINEIFDVWELKKTPLDFHLIFPDWHEQDLRAFVRRDRNAPSVIMWSFGNEVGEQYTAEKGAALAERLHNMVREEDSTRPTTVAMNYAKPDMPLPAVVDVISLNYQGEGIRNEGPYKGLKGITTQPQFPAFHEKFPNKVIQSSENASAVSSRGEYLFPVYPGNSAPVRDTMGGNSKTRQVSSYELYSVDFGSSADKVFATMDKHPYVAGGYVWTGWDYLGEPTPYYLSRSSYSGIIDLAGFKKDRFYLYQAYWRPELPMAHILPHWNWPDRHGKITPVHVFTSGDEAELFLNGKSLGRKKKAKYEYRLRWDDVNYVPGELKVIAFKNGKKWAQDIVTTTGIADAVKLSADRNTIQADGKDLSFVTVWISDSQGRLVPQAKDTLHFSIEGPGEIVATDNGDASSLIPFGVMERPAFNGLCLVIIRGKAEMPGTIKLKVTSGILKESTIEIKTIKGSKLL